MFPFSILLLQGVNIKIEHKKYRSWATHHQDELCVCTVIGDNNNAARHHQQQIAGQEF